MGKFTKLQINSNELNDLEWSSVYWNDEFTRPDIYTKYVSRVFTYDEANKTFSTSREQEEAAYNRTIKDHNLNRLHHNDGRLSAGVTVVGFYIGGGVDGELKNEGTEKTREEGESGR